MIHGLIVCADGVNILGGSVHTVMETIGLEVSADKKTKLLVMSEDQNAE